MGKAVLWQIVYWLSTPILFALAGILFWRKETRTFPLFFCYLLAAGVDDIVRVVVYTHGPRYYRRAFWITQLVNTVFMLLATYELSLTRLFPLFYRVSFYRRLFSIAGVIALGLGVSAIVVGGVSLAAVGNAINVLNVLQVVALFFFVGLMLFMGRHWSPYELGIAAGLGVNAAAFLITFTIILSSGPLPPMFKEFPTFAVDIASLIWLVTFLRPAKARPMPSEPLRPEVLTEARKWQEAAKGSLTQKKDSE